MKKRTKPALVLLAFLVLVGLFAGLYLNARPVPVAGTKSVTVNIVHSDQSTKTFHYQTDLEYLGELLQAEQLIVSEQGAYGLYITEADGEVATFEQNNAYWALYEGDSYAMQGADATVLADGAVFSLVYTLG